MTRKLFAVLMLVGALQTVMARIPDNFDDYDRHRQHMLADCKATAVSGDINALLTEEDSYCWHNGVSLFTVVIGDKSLGLSSCKDPKDGYQLVKRGKVWCVGGKQGYTARFRKIGLWNLLVINNATGQAVDVLIGDDTNRERLLLNNEMHDLLDGLYVNGKDEIYSFGNPSYYKEERDKLRYNTAPGMYQVAPRGYPQDPWYTNRFYFADGRMKYVPEPDATRKEDADGTMHYYVNGKEVSDAEYYNVMAPGHGGHGALLGPVEWEWTLTDKGIHIKRLIADDNWRDYSPYTDDVEFDLSKMKGSFDDVYPGMWGVASVRPLSAAMLKYLTKADLKLMRQEILARYGVAFSDKATQAYFNKQPWYESKGITTHKLTAIEQLNTEIIKSLENKRK